MLSSEAERCALLIVEAAAEIAGIRPPKNRHYSPVERLGFASQVFACYGGLANAPLVKAVLESWRAYGDDPESLAARSLFERHAELAYRNYCTQDRPAPGRMISDELLREIDAALRGAYNRIVTLSHGDPSGATIKSLGAIAAALDKLEYRSEASRVPDLVKAEERA